MTTRDGLDPQQLAEPVRVDVDQDVGDDVGVGAADEQGRHPQGLERGRRLRQLAVRRHDRALAVPVTKASFAVSIQVLEHLLLQELAWRVAETARLDASRDRVLHGRERAVGALALRPVECDRRRYPDGRIEENGPANAVGLACEQLEDQAAAEAVAQPVGLLDAQPVDELEDVGDVVVEAPGRLPLRPPVAAEVGREHAKRRQAVLGELAEAAAVPEDAVQADERRGVAPAPLVHVEHSRSFRRRTPCHRTGYLRLLLAILYDIHGNVPALERVLADAERAGARRYLIGGDIVAWEPLGRQALALLRGLASATWIRGNGERWLREPPLDRPDVALAVRRMSEQLSDEVDALYGLPGRAELEGMLFVHGSPLSDVESFAPEPDADDERLLDGVHDRTVVFGHSHLQFRRAGPDGTELVNPGSLGMPLDGDRRAAWALWDGDFRFFRSEYDVERAAAAYRDASADVGEFFARRIERGSD